MASLIAPKSLKGDLIKPPLGGRGQTEVLRKPWSYACELFMSIFGKKFMK